MSSVLSPSVSSSEIERFSAVADEWWSPKGAFRALHELTPTRLSYVIDQIERHFSRAGKNKKGLEGLRILDVGCGGGLMAEALAQRGADVTGIDASQRAIDVACAHAKESGLAIDYRMATAEEAAKTGQSYDVILALEIVEHVASLKSFMKAIASLLRPEGIVIVATLNRTKRSYLLGVVMAEYVLGWVPAGTHDWDKFVKPSELEGLWSEIGVRGVDLTGLVYRPLSRQFSLCKGNAAVNYFMTGKKVNLT